MRRPLAAPHHQVGDRNRHRQWVGHVHDAAVTPGQAKQPDRGQENCRDQARMQVEREKSRSRRAGGKQQRGQDDHHRRDRVDKLAGGADPQFRPTPEHQQASHPDQPKAGGNQGQCCFHGRLSKPLRTSAPLAQQEWVPLHNLCGNSMRQTGPSAKRLQSISRASERWVFSLVMKVTR